MLAGVGGRVLSASVARDKLRSEWSMTPDDSHRDQDSNSVASNIATPAHTPLEADLPAPTAPLPGMLVGEATATLLPVNKVSERDVLPEAISVLTALDSAAVTLASTAATVTVT